MKLTIPDRCSNFPEKADCPFNYDDQYCNLYDRELTGPILDKRPDFCLLAENQILSEEIK
jgi:hypothetical protein